MSDRVPDLELRRVLEEEGFDAAVQVAMAREVAFRDQVLADRARENEELALIPACLTLLMVPILIYMLVISNVAGIVFAGVGVVLGLVAVCVVLNG